MEAIIRDYSVLTGDKVLEHLYTIKDFPIFFGCTSKPESEDLRMDMTWVIDPNTGMIQLKNLVPLEILYQEQHVDATGLTWKRYNEEFANYITKYAENDIVEIGGGSGKIANLVLEQLKNITYTVVEPNPIFEERERLKVIPEFFNKDLKGRLNSKNNTIVFSQLFEHIYDPKEFLTEIRDFLEVGDKMIFAYPNLEYWFGHKFTNSINFEHTLLMTDYFVDYLLSVTGFEIIEKLAYENHSHFYHVEKVNSEVKFDLENRYEHYKQMFDDFVEYHLNIVSEINSIMENNDGEYYLFGGHIFSQFLISFGLNTDKIVGILDNSQLKQNKRLYGSKLIVQSPIVLKEISNPIVILKAGLYNEEIKRDIIENINPSVKFI